jgi:hypothetical protein
MITREARTRRVRPRIFPPARLRQDVIDGQVAPGERFVVHDVANFRAAVDTRVVVAGHDSLAAPLGMTAGDVDVVPQGNNGRHGKLIADRAQVAPGFFDSSKLIARGMLSTVSGSHVPPLRSSTRPSTINAVTFEHLDNYLALYPFSQVRAGNGPLRLPSS